MLLSIHVKPNSKTDHIGCDAHGNLKVKIRAQPVDGKANDYLIDYLSGIFGVPKSHIRLLKGSKNQYKKVEILGDLEILSTILKNL
jgi:uncharacterized protein (TIGR00251 family)